MWAASAAHSKVSSRDQSRRRDAVSDGATPVEARSRREAGSRASATSVAAAPLATAAEHVARPVSASSRAANAPAAHVRASSEPRDSDAGESAARAADSVSGRIPRRAIDARSGGAGDRESTLPSRLCPMGGSLSPKRVAAHVERLQWCTRRQRRAECRGFHRLRREFGGRAREFFNVVTGPASNTSSRPLSFRSPPRARP